MHSLYTYTTPVHTCSYLPQRKARLEYELVAKMSPAEYLQRMLDGWRRFGHLLFHPVCDGCRECRPLRIRVADFREDRSQRRNRKQNSDVELRIGHPKLSPDKLSLYDRYHRYQETAKGWPGHPPKDASQYKQAFVDHPFVVEEWCYYLHSQLVGVGYVDAVNSDTPETHGHEGLSAIYFFWEPTQRERGLGTWNILSLVDAARQRGLPYVYLGYYVAGCKSMEYKPRFGPNEIRDDTGQWRPFR
jgi:arginine-tRNA-protein transferase